MDRRSRLVDAQTGAVVRGADLLERTSASAEAYAALPPGVAFLMMPSTVDSVLRYVGARDARRPVALLDPSLPTPTLLDFIQRFEPAAMIGLASDAVVGPVPEGYRRVDDPALGSLWTRRTPTEHVPHPDLGLLLATSGSTGDPRFVRLSAPAIVANTQSIVGSLGIGPEDVTVSTLPFFYSFGMSVMNTHLAVGATIVIESGGMLGRPFWDAVRTFGVTSLAMVPAQYEVLRRLRFDPSTSPSVRTLTQAGGRLRSEVVLDFHQRMTSVGGRLFVMYGQTEGGPRLTTLPADRLPEKVGSVGVAIDGGRLTIRTEDGMETTESGVRGEIIYRGPNVMMGYGTVAADLALADTLGGVLETGDLGHLDDEGFLFIDGRRSRFGKVFGVRLNLDDIESMLQAKRPVAAVAGEDRIVLWVEGADAEALVPLVAALSVRLRLHHTGFELRTIAALPLRSSGKVDYRALESAG